MLVLVFSICINILFDIHYYVSLSIILIQHYSTSWLFPWDQVSDKHTLFFNSGIPHLWEALKPCTVEFSTSNYNLLQILRFKPLCLERDHQLVD